MNRKTFLAVLLSVLVAVGFASAYRMLSVTEEGLYYRNRLDVSDWESGEDFIYLRSYYIPWQGEDSIDYELSLAELKVNGEVVGVNLLEKQPDEVQDPSKIVTVQTDPEHLDALDEFPELTAVSLVGIRDEKELAKLAELPNLRALDVAYSKISDVGLSYIAALGELRVLNLASTEVSDAGLAHLAKLKHLRSLDLESTEITDEGLAYLKDLEDLRSLNLFRTKAGGGAESLALRGRPLKVTDEGLKALAGLDKLSELNLHGAAITNEGVKHIAAMTRLHKLNLSATGINDDCVDDLAKMKGLYTLDIKGTDISPAKVAELRKLLPDCEINY